MRISSSIFVFFLLPLYLCSCRIVFPYDNDLVEQPSFVSPEMTFRTFTAAVRNDVPGIEYKSFSETFKEKYDISLTKYSLARARMLQDNPNVSWVGRMGIDESKQNDERNAFVLASIFGKKLLVRMVRQDYAFITMQNGETRDFFLSESVANAIRGSETRWMILIENPELRGIDRSQVSSFQLLPEWKIDGFEQPSSP